MAFPMPFGYQTPRPQSSMPQIQSNVPQQGRPTSKPSMPPVMMPSETNPEDKETVDKPELTDDEYYIEQLRKENLLRTVKDMKEKQIFLFEIFVDSIEITKENELLMSSDEMGPLPPLRVRIKFGNVPCFDIYEEEMLASAGTQQDALSGKVISLTHESQNTLRSSTQHGLWRSTYGKSCLFFMIPMELIRSIQCAPVTVKVYRTTENNYEHPASSVGHTRIRLEEDFVNCVLRTGDMKTEFPVSGYQSHPYTIHNLAGEETGKIDIFIRLSCFGNMISTQFQSLKDGREYVFKHSPGKPQLDSTITKDLPEDYVPPKLLGKTDLTTLLPLVVSEENVLGVCKELQQSKPVLKESMVIPKTVLWKEYGTKNFTDDVTKTCNCACLHDINNNKNNVQEYSASFNKEFESDVEKKFEPCICNESKESSNFEPIYELNTEETDSIGEKKCFCPPTCPFIDNVQISDDVKKCFCNECACKHVEDNTKKRFSNEPTILKPLEYEIKGKKNTEVLSSTVVSSSIKKLHLLGAGDSEEKNQSKKLSYSEAQVNEKKESEVSKMIEEGKISISSVELRTADNIQNSPVVNKTNSLLEIKRLTKKKGRKDGLNRKMYTQYDYSIREYPGLNIGHKFCVDNISIVPETMGWLWNIEDKCLGLKPRKGWRPGAIGKSINIRICHSKKVEPSIPDHLPPSTGRSKYQGGRPFKQGDKIGSFSDLIDQPPTFRMQQTGGKYYLSMVPIKEEDDVGGDQKPVQMQVVPESSDDSLCDSRKTSDTSMEVVFTCPGALRRRREKPTIADIDTQYLEGDFKHLYEKSRTSTKGKKKGKKGGKGKTPKTAKTEETDVKDNLWEEQQTQMSMQKKKEKK